MRRMKLGMGGNGEGLKGQSRELLSASCWIGAVCFNVLALFHSTHHSTTLMTRIKLNAADV